jgi:hypothetical protein
MVNIRVTLLHTNRRIFREYVTFTNYDLNKIIRKLNNHPREISVPLKTSNFNVVDPDKK